MKILRVKVKPNAKRQEIREEADGSWTAYLTAPPIAGKANQALIQLLAKTLKVPQAQIRIKTGATAKTKLVEIADA